MPQRRQPCSDCPFVHDGSDGGGSPLTYVGQAAGPFLLPCHQDPKYYEDKRSRSLEQCAGAAIYRANTGVAARMPEGILSLPARSSKRVFTAPETLLAYHLDITLDAAQQLLFDNGGVEGLLQKELADQNVKPPTP